MANMAGLESGSGGVTVSCVRALLPMVGRNSVWPGMRGIDDRWWKEADELFLRTLTDGT